MPQWCIVTSRTADGRPYSLDVFARSSFDAVLTYQKMAMNQPEYRRTFPKPTEKTVFEIRVAGSKTTQLVSYRKVWEWSLKKCQRSSNGQSQGEQAGALAQAAPVRETVMSS
jgi:hypothetical protein